MLRKTSTTDKEESKTKNILGKEIPTVKISTSKLWKSFPHHADNKIHRIPFNELKSKAFDGEVTISEPSEIFEDIETLSALRDFAFQSYGKTSIKPPNETSSKCILEFEDIQFPSSFSLCPTLKDVENAMTNDLLVLNIKEFGGYNFFSEFEHIYRGKSNKRTSFRDAVAVCKRALLAIEPSMDESLAQLYTEYIIRIAAWEVHIGNSACTSTIGSSLPLITVCAMKRSRYSIASIFIGHNEIDHSLSFCVRVCPEVDSVAISLKKSKIVPPPRYDDVKILSASRFCYYRRFYLNKSTVEELEAFSELNSTVKSKNLPPPPPPKPPSPKDIALFIVCAQQLATGEGEFLSMQEFDEDDALDFEVSDDWEVPAKDNNIKNIGNINSLEPTPCAELIGWGHNSQRCLGVDDEELYEPRSIPLPPSISLERVLMIACSPRHTVLLTYLGNVYSCGENSEGALGHGDVISKSAMTLIPWPEDATNNNSNPPKIIKVAAGSGSIGSHSMALDNKGKLYGWGVNYAIGLSQITTPVLAPTQIVSFPVHPDDRRLARRTRRQQNGDDNLEDDDDDNDDDDNDESRTRLVTEALPCIDVSCGGGFTVAILRSGRVCSWGMWSHGRLGLGEIPMITTKGFKRKSSTLKAARYQLSPALVRGIKNAVNISCGEAHVICCLKNGNILSWGQNSCGQLGTGPTPSGFLRDEYTPVLVSPFGSSSSDISNNSNEVIKAKLVCAGSFHSAAIDTLGRAWTWGGRGSASLGHYDSGLEGDWSRRIKSVFAAGTTSTKMMIPHELLQWCNRWSTPRHIESLDDIEVVQLCCGDLHTGFLSNTGQLFMCGIGAVVPPYIPVSMLNDEKIDEDLDNSDDVDMANFEKNIEKHTEKIAKFAVVVNTPRRPCASWFTNICTRRTKVIAASGTRMFIVQDEEFVSYSLTDKLLRKTLLGPNSGTPSEDQDIMDDLSLSSYAHSDGGSVGSYFENRGKADCMILASGKILLAHRALLGQRSPELRDMIAMETPSDEPFEQPTQILLPELHNDTARALLSFIYTDVLPLWCIGNVSVLHGLQRAGLSLRMPRLQLLCERMLRVINAADFAASNDNPEFDIPKLEMELPPMTLSRDLGSIVGDPQFADVRFVAEGRAILAHRFILESRCEYFRVMFRSGSTGAKVITNKEKNGKFGGIIDVVVPDSFIGFLRFLIFIYTDSLPDGADESLLEDLLSADRYVIIISNLFFLFIFFIFYF
jgi:alpha-tubulin suppressor-like RCC1 family protein